MDYKVILEKLGLTEGVDFSINPDGSFTKLQKTRLVDQIVHHETVPAVLDANGVEISPEIPAYDETIQITETYFDIFPSAEQIQETFMQIEISKVDITELITAYLAGKRGLVDPENDSINIVEGRIHGWDFKNIPVPSQVDLFNLVATVQSKHSKESKLAQISALEAQVTPRRIREAVLSGDKSFIESIDAQITAIRATIG